MPVIEASRYDSWLNAATRDANAASRLLVPFAGSKRRYPVSTRVNQVQNDDAECAQPVELVPPQSKLFARDCHAETYKEPAPQKNERSILKGLAPERRIWVSPSSSVCEVARWKGLAPRCLAGAYFARIGGTPCTERHCSLSLPSLASAQAIPLRQPRLGDQRHSN